MADGAVRSYGSNGSNGSNGMMAVYIVLSCTDSALVGQFIGHKAGRVARPCADVVLLQALCVCVGCFISMDGNH